MRPTLPTVVARIGAVMVATVSATLALGADQPRDFAKTMPLTTAGAQSHFELAVPPEVYEGVVHADLADVRVFNGAGEAVPIALRPRAPLREAPPSLVVLTPFALRGNTASGVDAAIIRLERRGDQLKLEMKAANATAKEVLLGYLVDTSHLKQAVRSFRFELEGTQDVSTALSIQASDDLRSWQPVADHAPILRLEAGGQRLVQDRVEFPARAVRYWRIVFPAPRGPVALKAVIAELVEGTLEPVRHRREIIGAPAPDRPGDVLFDARGQFPIERVRLIAPEVNSVAMIEVFSRAKPTEPWITRARGTVFRLLKDGVETASTAMPVPNITDRYWLVRVDQRGGGLGAGVPSLAIDWQPHHLIFVARGQGPFQLAFGSAIAQSSMMSFDAMVPVASTTESAAGKIAPVPSAVFAKAEPGIAALMAGDRARAQPFPWRTWALWVSIVAAVAMLAWMAWRLTRQLKASAPAESP